MLSETQRRFWADNGFLVLPGFCDEDDLEAITTLLRRAWNERVPRIVVDDVTSNRRTLLRDVAADAAREHIFKVNDLYLEYPEVRRLSIGTRIAAILGELLEDAPVLINTLNFSRGSTQPYHVDSLYMTPRSTNGLVATWIALEDCHPDAGPLQYFPESQRIAPFRFTDGSHHATDAEMPAWNDYVMSEVERRRLGETRFNARRGDLFIWHAYLLHGGSPICNPALSRHSLVSHFWTRTDCRAWNLDLVPVGDAFWYRRAHQPVPGSADGAPDSSAVPPPVARASALGGRLRRLATRLVGRVG